MKPPTKDEAPGGNGGLGEAAQHGGQQQHPTTPEAQSRFVVAVNILGVDRVYSEHDHLADARTACTEAWRTGLDARVLQLRRRS